MLVSPIGTAAARMPQLPGQVSPGCDRHDVAAGPERVRRAGHRLDRDRAAVPLAVQRVAGEDLPPARTPRRPRPRATARAVRGATAGTVEPPSASRIDVAERGVELRLADAGGPRCSRTGRRPPWPRRSAAAGRRSAAGCAPAPCSTQVVDRDAGDHAGTGGRRGRTGTASAALVGRRVVGAEPVRPDRPGRPQAQRPRVAGLRRQVAARRSPDRPRRSTACQRSQCARPWIALCAAGSVSASWCVARRRTCSGRRGSGSATAPAPGRPTPGQISSSA